MKPPDSDKPKRLDMWVPLVLVFSMLLGAMLSVWSPPETNLPVKKLPLLHDQEPDEVQTEPLSKTAATAANTQQERFNKLDATGAITLHNDFWSCVADAKLKLVWEVKTNDGGWRDREHRYSWYTPAADEQRRGKANAGQCLKIDCDTHSYIQALNNNGLCGRTSWRLPSEHELRSLDHPNNYFPDIDTDYFPHSMSASYWTHTQSSGNPKIALAVDFSNNIGYWLEKRIPNHLRLVSDNHDERKQNSATEYKR